MIRQYANKKIYKNLLVAEILSIIALIVSIIIFIIDLIKYFITVEFNHDILFYMNLVFVPALTTCFNNNNCETSTPTKGTKDNNFIDRPIYPAEKRFKNDYFYTILRILCSFIPVFYLISEFILALLFGFSDHMQSDILIAAQNLGAMSVSHSFLYIANIFLIINCFLIKREWKDNPPAFKTAKKQVDAKRKEQKTLTQKKKVYTRLIEKSGIKFFVKYYEQIKKLPLRDVEIVGNYSLEEKQERLYAAKKIIDLNLTEFALNEILTNYDLNSDEQAKIKTILNKLETNRN